MCDGKGVGFDCGTVADPGNCFVKTHCYDTETDSYVCCDCRSLERDVLWEDFGGSFLPIDDNHPDDLTVTLMAGHHATILDLVVQLVIQHTWIGDLAATLTHGTTTITLMDRPGSDGSNYGCDADLTSDHPIYFFDGAARPIQCGPETMCPLCFPSGQVGSLLYVPAEALAAFQGQDVYGPWIFSISDNAPGETGSLHACGILVDSDYPVSTGAVAETGSWGRTKAAYR